jgi:hypothetical protein
MHRTAEPKRNPFQGPTFPLPNKSFHKRARAQLLQQGSAFFNYRMAYRHLNGMVDRKHRDGRSPHARESNQQGTVPTEMIGPNIAPRMKQAAQPLCLRINAGNIGSFVLITDARLLSIA